MFPHRGRDADVELRDQADAGKAAQRFPADCQFCFTAGLALGHQEETEVEAIAAMRQVPICRIAVANVAKEGAPSRHALHERQGKPSTIAGGTPMRRSPSALKTTLIHAWSVGADQSFADVMSGRSLAMPLRAASPLSIRKTR
jgi:hypothetical protein